MNKIYPFPISMFESVRNPVPIEQAELAFTDFAQALSSFSEEQYASKASAPLFASTRFSNERRAKANATMSGLVVLDIDDGQTIDETVDIVKTLDTTAIVYSTASHSVDHHKFRVCIPLSEPVDYDKHALAWRAINEVFAGGAADSTKVGCESLFYVPGQYPNAPNFFAFLPGKIETAADWIDVVGDIPAIAVSSKVVPLAPRQIARASRSGRSASSDDLDFFETKLITEPALNKYWASANGWHHARFGLMLHIVGRAKRMGITVGQSDVITLFNQVDIADGGHYQSTDYQRQIANDAAKAASQAG